MIPGASGKESASVGDAKDEDLTPGSGRSFGVFCTFLVSQVVKNLPAMQETRVPSLGWEDPLEKGMATHSSILALKNPMDRGAGRLQSMESQSRM